MGTKVNIIASEKNWIEGEAIRQLEKSAELPGMVKAIGMPDLHPGKGFPVGAAFISEKVFYPYLVGNDIGCGMGLWQSDLKAKKLKLDKWVNKLDGLENKWEGNTTQWLSDYGIEATEYDSSLGTIGGGNHFCELQMIHKISNQEEFDNLGLDKDYLFLLTHSGSRGLGESILRSHTDKFSAGSLEESSDDAKQYLEKHNHAVIWAKANRALITYRFFEALGTEGKLILDVCHNSVTPAEFEQCSCWLHRKGAAPSDKGPVVIPGSRGSYSYLVIPTEQNKSLNGFSLAHGAGRKWGRGDSKSRLQSKYSIEDLKKTELGSYVICEDKNLIYEEAPQAYKDIDTVVQDLIDAELIKVIAVLKPLITYKTRKK